MNQTDESSVVEPMLAAGKVAQGLWELGTFIISVGSAIGAFISKVGGVTQFLVEVGFFGIAAYVGLFFVVTPLLMLLAGAERVTSRETTDKAFVVFACCAAVVGAFVVRFLVFDDQVAEDLDAIGTAFGVILGIVILAMPLVLLWYFKGSRPTQPPSPS